MYCGDVFCEHSPAWEWPVGVGDSIDVCYVCVNLLQTVIHSKITNDLKEPDMSGWRRKRKEKGI